MRRFLLILLAIALTIGSASEVCAQKKKRTSDTVRKEQQTASKKVKQTKQQIEENKQRTRQQLNTLNAINADVRSNRQEIVRLDHQLQATNQRIKIVTDSIDSIQQKVDVLKESARMSLRNARTSRQSISSLSMIFSSESFNQAIKRAGYLKQLDKWRAAKTVALKDNLTLLNATKATLDTLKSQQAATLALLGAQQTQLDKNLAETQKIVNNLKKQGKNLEAELNERNRQLKRLNQELERIIAEEARIAAEQERKRLAEEKRKKEEEERRRLAETQKGDNKPSDNTQTKTKPADAKPADTKPKTPIPADASFAQLKGRLGSPISGTATVVGRFGRTKHEDLSRVEIDNPGIDIQGKPGATALAVHKGTVSSIFHLDGYHNIVMVRHGEYLTVYANIDKLSVKKGDNVTAGQSLGSVYSDKTDGNRTILHFEVRHEREKLNPLDWVKM